MTVRQRTGTANPAHHYQRHLAKLTKAVMLTIAAIDGMAKQLDGDRGSRIAKLVNELEMANDHARYFGLGIDFRKDKKLRAVGEDAPGKEG